MPFYPARSESIPRNPDETWKTLGTGTGSGTILSNPDLVANSLGNWTPIGTASQDFRAIEVILGGGENNSHRIAFQLSFDGGATAKTPLIYFGSASARTSRIPLPLKGSSGAQIQMRIQGASQDTDLSAAVRYLPFSPTEEPGFETCFAITTLGASTRPGSASIPLSTSEAAFTEVVSSLPEDLGALFMSFGELSTPTVFQMIALTTAMKTDGSSWTPIDSILSHFSPSAPQNAHTFSLIRKSLPVGTQIGMNLLAATADAAATGAVCLVGFR